MSGEQQPKLMNRNFFLLWQGQTISLLGNQAFAIGIAFWVKHATGSASLMGLVAMLASLPSILLGPLAGTAADRFSRRRILILSDSISGLAILALAAVVFVSSRSNQVPVFWIAVLALVAGTAQAFFMPAISAAIPDLAPASQLAAANSLIQSSVQLSVFIGQAIGGVLFRVLGAPLLLLFDGLSFLYAALSETLIVIPQKVPEKAKDWRSAVKVVASDTAEGVRYLWANAGLRNLVLASTALNGLIVPVILMLPFYVEDYLKTTTDWYGFLLAGYSIGSLVGYVGAGSLKMSSRTRGRAVLIAMLIEAPAPASLILTHSPVVALALMFAGGLIMGFVAVHVMSILQLTTPSEIRGRLFGVLGTISGGFAPLVMGISGMLADMVGRNIPLIFVSCGVAMAVVTIVMSMGKNFRVYLETAGSSTANDRSEVAYAS